MLSERDRTYRSLICDKYDIWEVRIWLRQEESNNIAKHRLYFLNFKCYIVMICWYYNLFVSIDRWAEMNNVTFNDFTNLTGHYFSFKIINPPLFHNYHMAADLNIINL